jgi:N-acyl-D-amino-acid deacylase
MMMGMPLDFDPGSKSIYSNFGYNVLGRVIEQVSGQSYEHFTLDRVLKPAGIQAMRLGRTRAEDRAPGEVHYYGPGEISTMPSAFPGEGFASIAYGFYAVEAMDAHGGWLASAADLVRFATAVDGQRGEPLLTQASFEAMIQTPRPSFTIGGSGGDVGLGWEATPTANGVDWSREGALPETCISWVIRTSDGLALAFTFNTLPAGWADFFPTAEAALLATAADVQTWPDHDLFAR